MKTVSFNASIILLKLSNKIYTYWSSYSRVLQPGIIPLCGPGVYEIKNSTH